MTKATQNGVRAPYTFETIRQSLIAQRDALDAKGKKMSYRKIAAKYGVSHAAIHRAVVYGIEPKDTAIRHALGLPQNAVTVSPLSCGHAPLAKRCPICQQATKYAPHPVARWTVIERKAFAVLAALHTPRQSSHEN